MVCASCSDERQRGLSVDIAQIDDLLVLLCCIVLIDTIPIDPQVAETQL
jgi:hypothetical protein